MKRNGKQQEAIVLIEAGNFKFGPKRNWV